MCH
jgi:hypothetical protein